MTRARGESRGPFFVDANGSSYWGVVVPVDEVGSLEDGVAAPSPWPLCFLAFLAGFSPVIADPSALVGAVADVGAPALSAGVAVSGEVWVMVPV